jgi:hypothetical protein
MATVQQDFLAQQRAEIEKRKAELAPLVEEYNRLEQAAAALDAIPVATSAGNGQSTPQRARARVKAAGAKTASRGRPKGSGRRDAEAAAIVAAHPQGITIPEIAAKVGIKQNYLYRVLPALATEGKVVKGSERRWFPAEAA